MVDPTQPKWGTVVDPLAINHLPVCNILLSEASYPKWLLEAQALLRPPDKTAIAQPTPEFDPEPMIQSKNPQDVGWYNLAQNTLTS